MKPPQIAVIATTYSPFSHADVIVSRYLEAWPDDQSVGWAPQTQIASLFVDQFPPRAWGEIPKNERERTYQADVDMARWVSRQYDVPLYDSIRAALCLGGEELAVDGVLLIGEHGNYPLNERGQKLYPRREFFEQIVAVFRESKRVVPLFCDKALSYDPVSARQMAQTIEALKIPFLGGSSLPQSGFALGTSGQEPPPDAFIEEMVLCFSAGPEAYGFHSIDWSHALLEGRGAGTLKSLRVYEGEAVWNALENGAWSRDLFEAMLAQCQLSSNRCGEIKANCLDATLHREASRARSEFLISPVAFTLQYEDAAHQNATRVTHCFLKGHTNDFALALRWRDESGEPHVFAARSGSSDPADVPLGHFARLNAQIQAMILSGHSSVPLRRTLDSSLATAAVMEALWRQAPTGTETAFS